MFTLDNIIILKFTKEGLKMSEINSEENVTNNSAGQQANFNNQHQQNSGQNMQQGESKTGIGVLCAFLLGLIGLLIGYLLYKDKKLDYEWSTFLKGWIWTYVISIIASVGFFIFLLMVSSAG